MATRRIVVGIDGSAGSDAATAWCAEMAGPLDAEVVAVHAVNPLVQLVPPTMAAGPLAYYPAESNEALQADLELHCEPLRAAGVPYRARLAAGDAAAVLIREADVEDAALIVVGRRGSGGFSELVFGSVPHHLSHHASRPVVVIPVPSTNQPATGQS